VNDTRRPSRFDSPAHCSNETREKGASRASVAAARRNGVGDAIFGHGGTRTERSDTTDTALF
jgi:hypothetical protein